MNFSKTLLFFVFVASSMAVSAQKFSYGLKAGVLGVYTNFPDTKDSLKSSVKPGFALGGFVGFPLKRNCTFLVEGGASQQGRAYKYTYNGDRWNSTYYFADLSMALRKNFHWRIIKNFSTDWFVEVGPNINYWFYGKTSLTPYRGIKQNYSLVFNGTGHDFDKIYINDANRWLYGINVGLGFSAVTKRYQKFNTALRMTWGQTYVGKRHSEYIEGVAGIENEINMKCNLKVLTLSVAYVFERDIQRGRMGKSTKKVK